MATGNTNVPNISFTDNGFVPPSQAQVLAGVIADIQTAFGNKLNLSLADTSSLSTPQGQLASTEAAVIANANALLCKLFNGVDPAYASGRMQDGIAQIYFIERHPAQSTVVTCTCIGLAGAVIPQFALAIDTVGNVYYAVDGGTIPVSGTIDLDFANQVTGPIPCPADTLTTIYQTIFGWDTINNSADGVLGNDVETRAAFEARRQASVAGNAMGMLPAIRGAVLSVAGVIDAFTAENYYTYQNIIDVQATANCTVSGTTLTVNSMIFGAIAIDQYVSFAGVATGTQIASGSGSSWVLSAPAMSVTSAVVNFGAVPMVPNSIYVAASGGTDQDVATAIWTKKAPGCAYNGNVTVTVYDANPPYVPPGIPYSVTFQRPTDIAIMFNVSIANSVNVPSNAAAQIQAAIIKAFLGQDGGLRATMNGTILSSRYYAGITGLGTWAQLLALTIGSTQTPDAVIATSTISGFTLTVGSLTSGTVAIGQRLFGAGVVDGTVIIAGSGSSWIVNLSQSVGSTTIDCYAVTSTAVTMLADQEPTLSASDVIVTLV